MSIRDVIEMAGSVGVKPKHEIVSASHYAATTPPPSDWILDGLFEVGDKVGVIASSKRKKSWFVLQMAACIATGKPFLDWHVRTRRRVLLVQLEIKPEHYHRRVHMVAQGIQSSPDDLGDWLGICSARGDVVDAIALETLAAQWGCDLLIVDPLYKFAQGDENKAEDLKPVLQSFDRICKVKQTAICWVHHDAKGKPGDRNDRDRGAGSNIMVRDVDQLFTLTPHKDNTEWTVVRTLARNAEDKEPVTIAWERGAFVTNGAPADVETSEGVSAPGRKPQHKLADALAILAKAGSLTTGDWRRACDSERGISKSTFFRLLQEAQDTKKIEEAGGKWQIKSGFRK